MSFAAVLERLTKLENPYPGLRRFDTHEAHLFFGRDRQVLDLLERLARNRFVAVLGLSGSGKSSLVRAGLIPALQRGRLVELGLRWRTVVAQPGGAAFANLAKALGCTEGDLRASSHGLLAYAHHALDKDKALLVVIDQFEELFRYKDRLTVEAGSREWQARSAEAAAFIELLLIASRATLPLYVVITMRTDYLGDCAEFPEFPETLNESQYLVPRLTRDQRRQAIEGPLGTTRISSALVEAILNEAGDEPDQLPVLQHALMRTWSQWRRASGDRRAAIGLEDYEAAGRFAGALNQHANELLDSPAVRAEPTIVEVIFKRLTAVGRGNRERRDPAPLSDLWALCQAESEEERRRVDAVIDVFRRDEATFLAPADGELKEGTYVDVVHESLIRNWKILREEWAPEEEHQAKTLFELLDRARGWRAGKRSLLGGLDLAAATEWDLERNRSAKWAEQYGVDAGAVGEIEAFLNASREEFEKGEREKEREQERQLAAEQRLREAAEQKAQVERAAVRRIRISFYLMAILLILALTFASIAFISTRRARVQQKIAESRALAARAETLTFLGDGGEAIDAAIRAYSIAPTSEAIEAVAHAFPQQLLTVTGQMGAVYSANFSPDGQCLATASNDKTARVWNAATGQVIAKLEGHTGRVISATFSPDGQHVTTASDDHTARVWDAATGSVIAKLGGHTGSVSSAVFSPDGQRVVTASDDKTARVWNAATGQVIAKLQGHAFPVVRAVFSSDGKRVVTASNDKTARVWDAMTGQVTANLEGHADSVVRAVFSPDGQRVVTASFDKTARVWNAATGQVIAKLEGHADAVYSAVFSPDGQRVVTASDDHTARVWNAATGQVIAELEGHAEPVYSAVFSPDGQRVVTASSDRTARVWNAATGQMIAKLEGHAGSVWSAVFSPDGQRVATASYDRTVRVWNTAAGQVIAKLQGHASGVNSAVFSPDGQRVVTTSFDRTARVWNTETGQVIAKLEGHATNVNSAVFSPDGQRVVTASLDKTARVWDAGTGQVIAKLEGHVASVYSAVFSPEGRRVVTASYDHTARVWNAETGQVIAKLEGHAARVYSAVFSPEGRRVVTASYDHTARVWDAETGQVIAKLEGHLGPVYSAVFSPDERRVVTASDDKTARVWNAVTGQAIAQLKGHAGPVLSAVFSPDGQRVATASLDRTAWMWNAETGQVIAKLEGQRARS